MPCWAYGKNLMTEHEATAIACTTARIMQELTLPPPPCPFPERPRLLLCCATDRQRFWAGTAALYLQDRQPTRLVGTGGVSTLPRLLLRAGLGPDPGTGLGIEGVVVLGVRKVPMSRWPASMPECELRSAPSATADLGAAAAPADSTHHT